MAIGFIRMNSRYGGYTGDEAEFGKQAYLQGLRRAFF